MKHQTKAKIALGTTLFFAAAFFFVLGIALNDYIDSRVPLRFADDVRVNGEASKMLKQEWLRYPPTEWLFCSDGRFENNTLIIENGYFTTEYNSTRKSLTFEPCNTMFNVHPHFSKNAQASDQDLYTFGSQSQVAYMCVMFDPNQLACYTPQDISNPIRVILQ